VALGLLYQRGTLDLDAPVQRYVPGFPVKRYPITVRQVAGHLAGIRHYLPGEFENRKHYATVSEGLSIFAGDSLLFEPGTRFEYSSYGYNLLSAVIEGARGRQVTFRLLDVDSNVELGYLHEARERNPALGQSGIRLLLKKEQVLRDQLKALLLAAGEAEVRVALPRINDCGELRRVKEILYEERFALRRDDAPRLSVG